MNKCRLLVHLIQSRHEPNLKSQIFNCMLSFSSNVYGHCNGLRIVFTSLKILHYFLHSAEIEINLRHACKINACANATLKILILDLYAVIL